MTEHSAHPRIGYILRSYPRLSQTFILNELIALERIGVPLVLFPMTNPREPITQPQVSHVRAPVHYLDAALRRNRRSLGAEQFHLMRVAPRRFFETWRFVLLRPDLDAGYTTCSRWECLEQAVHLAHQVQRHGIQHLHAHFAHDPTLIALLTHRLTGVSYSFTAHARDLYQIPRRTLGERIKEASAVVSCAKSNVDYIRQIAGTHPIYPIYHGVNLERFQPAPRPENSRDVPRIVSVGRLVEKKGFGDLICACRQLKQAGYRFRCTIYGDGPLREKLGNLIEQLDLAGEVELVGARTQQELVPILQGASVFALTPFVTDDGDRDGVPNVLVEAMACGLPVVSTCIAAIPELVTQSHNGLLFEPHAIADIAAGLGELLTNEERRARLGMAARRTVVEHHDSRKAADQLAALFDRAVKRDLC